MKTRNLLITSSVILFVLIGIIIASNANNLESTEPENTKPCPLVNLIENTPNNIIGTWTKESATQEGHDYSGDKDWELTVTFNENGRFIWDSRRKGQDGNMINYSLSGTYTIEKGFIVNYYFENTSEQALERVPELFAYWPNKTLGQQTFRFQDGKFILGHDGGKLWISMNKKG